MNTLIIFITLLSVVNANPSKPGCDLIGSNSEKNVMKRTTIMGAVPDDATNLISFSSNKFNATGDVITVTISNLKTGGAVIHTSSGALSASNSEQATPAGYTAKTGCTDKMFYKQGGVGASLTLYLTIGKEHKTTVSVLTAAGQSTVTRQQKAVTSSPKKNSDKPGSKGGEEKSASSSGITRCNQSYHNIIMIMMALVMVCNSH
jgi:hypothetical protein